MTPWWYGLGAAEATIDCSGERHRVLWAGGALRALEHDDPEGERALAALGGERCACVELLDAWERCTADLDVLVLATRGSGDQLEPESDDPAAAAFMRARRRRRGPPGVDPQEELVRLLRLGGGFPERLVASVTELAEARAAAEPDVAWRLHAALYGRLLWAVRTWLGQPELSLELTPVGRDARRSVARAGDVVRAELPFSWIAEVWARGFTTILGRLCVAAESADGRRWSLTTIGPDFGEPQPIVLELPAALAGGAAT